MFTLLLMNPFVLFRRLLLAFFRLTGLTLVFLVQTAGYLYYRRKDKIFDALGYYGRGVIETLARIAEC